MAMLIAPKVGTKVQCVDERALRIAKSLGYTPDKDGWVDCKSHDKAIELIASIMDPQS